LRSTPRYLSLRAFGRTSQGMVRSYIGRLGPVDHLEGFGRGYHACASEQAVVGPDPPGILGVPFRPLLSPSST
jgi:hypothetical protein